MKSVTPLQSQLPGYHAFCTPIGYTVPSHLLFPQIESICRKFVNECLVIPPSAERVHVFQAPYYTWAIEILLQQIQPDTSAGESPEVPRLEPLRQEGSTSDVDFWTSKDVRLTKRSHVNYIIMDSGWEAQAAFKLDHHDSVVSYVKNAALGFTLPYMYNGEMHDFIPDFIVRLQIGDGSEPVNLVLETKGHDELREIKEAAAVRWLNAVNADGRFGKWRFRMASSVADVSYILDEARSEQLVELHDA